MYYVVEACHAAGYRYFGDWQELEGWQQEFLIAHYYAHRLLDSHQEDAKLRDMKRKQKKSK